MNRTYTRVHSILFQSQIKSHSFKRTWKNLIKNTQNQIFNPLINLFRLDAATFVQFLCCILL